MIIFLDYCCQSSHCVVVKSQNFVEKKRFLEIPKNELEISENFLFLDLIS